MDDPQVKIKYLTKIPSISDVNSQLADPVKIWVKNDLGTLNQVQRIAIPQIIKNKSTLVMAPTGAGKTLAAFLGIISELQRLEEALDLENKIYVLYISPLKALNNDIHKNLEIPLEAIRSLTGTKITSAKRTGDTPTKERQKLLRKPPHILITTPESLGLMLAAPKFKEHLRNIKWLIIDEIHSVADNKRGTLLSLCLERLEHYFDHSLTRIGLSATIEPAELVGYFLMGNRNVNLNIIDMGGIRKLDVEVISPVRNLTHAPFSLIKKRQLEYLTEYMDNNHTIIIFSNTRHMAELLVYDLIVASDEKTKDKIAVHHGSLNKEIRLDIENRLKKGEMKAVLTSTSLELGIDIGSIDLTVQLGSPKTVRALLQRIGRSGHSQNLVSKGKIIVFNRDDLIECVAISKLAIDGKIDAIRIPEMPSDVLIQMLVGMAVEKKWNFREAYSVISKSYPYKNLTYNQFLTILKSAADPLNSDDSWKYGHIWFDTDIEEFGKRKSARQAYLQNIGTIPDRTTISVVLQGFRTVIGQVSENFSEKLQENDVFLLGGKALQFIRSIGNKILVEDGTGLIPTVPSWSGEALTRTWEVSKEIDFLFENVEREYGRDKHEAINWLTKRYPIGLSEANIIVDYVVEQLSLSSLPRFENIIIETYKDPSGSTNIIVIMIYGLETNKALAQALSYILSKKLNVNIGLVSTDNGFMLKIPPGIDFDVYNLFRDLEVENFEKIIKESLIDSELFKLRFRHAAGRSLMILRKWGAHKISVTQQQRSSRWLMENLSAEFPIVKETLREILHDTFNIKRAIEVLIKIKTSDIEVLVLPISEIPSSMTHAILLNGELDVVMIEDRRNLLYALHQQVLSRLLPELNEFTTIFNDMVVNDYFSKKFQKGALPDRIRNWCEFTRITDNPVTEGCKLLEIEKEEFLNLVDSHPEIVKLLPKGYSLISLLPSYGAIRGNQFWNSYDLQNPLFEDAYTRSQHISSESGWEDIITCYLKYAGPSDIEKICNDLSTDANKLTPTIQYMLRRRIILQGHFISDKTEFLLSEDREQLIKSQITSQEINQNNLRDFRLFKMRLIPSMQSPKVGISDYLLNNGPARDLVELVSRLEKLSWPEIRRLLADQEIYFGRFLGRRLVFIHKYDLEEFILITRSQEKLTPERLKIFTLIAEVPELTTRGIVKIAKQSSRKIQEILNYLERDLYISRTGYNLSLMHGGTANPRYIALPRVEISNNRIRIAIERIIKRCCQWYGPLSLKDIIRITRLPYQSVENTLKNIEINSLRILGTLYYGYVHDFDQLVKFCLDEEDLNQVNLLSQLDPFFYMTSGYFRQNHLPRQTRLVILYRGMTYGYVEIAIPNKDVLQVINIQISKRRIKNYSLIRSVGFKLLDVARRVYLTPVVFIEEINFQPANHADNKLMVSILAEIGYTLHKDHLVIGTGNKHEFSNLDIIITRQLSQYYNKNDISSIDELFSLYSKIPVNQALKLLGTTISKSKLIFSHNLRSGKFNYRNGIFYRKDLYVALYGRETNDYNHILKILNKPKVSRQIANELSLQVSEVIKEISELLEENKIEIVSPFARILEYRTVPKQSLKYLERIRIVLLSLIEENGPISFNYLIKECGKIIQINRTQLLFVITDLLKEKRVHSASIRNKIDDKKEIMYFTKKQAEILIDPTKFNLLDKWKIFNKTELIYEQIQSEDTHIIVHYGIPVATFHFKSEIDIGKISNINLLSGILDQEIEITELISELENYIFGQGLLEMRIEKIQGAKASYWMEMDI